MAVLVIANLVVGVVIVESIFSYPGFGQAILTAARNRDIPLALACGIISGALYLSLNLLADLVVVFSNPRLRHPSATLSAAMWIIPPNMMLVWKRPRTKVASAILVVLLTGLGYAYHQWTKSDGVTHSNLNPPLWFRTALESDDLLNNTDYYLEPVHFDNFLPVGSHGPPTTVFEGTVHLPTFRLLSRVASRPTRWPGFVEAPGFDASFISVDDRIVPAGAGAMLKTNNDQWRVILDEGRTWSEPGDAPWSRASFPFTLIQYDERASFSAAATFLYKDGRISQLRIQIAQESAPDSEKFDYWGQTPTGFTPHVLSDHTTIEADHLAQLQARLDVRPWSDLQERFSGSVLNGFDGEQGKRHIRRQWSLYRRYGLCASLPHSIRTLSILVRVSTLGVFGDQDARRGNHPAASCRNPWTGNIGCTRARLCLPRHATPRLGRRHISRLAEHELRDR